jgi:type IV pilus assembly protein PilM
MFSHPFPNAFGIDLSDLSIKIVQLRNVSRRHHEHAYVPVICRSTKLPHGLIMNGIVQEPEKVRKYLQHILDGENPKNKTIKSHWAVASLPDIQGFLKRIEIDKPAEDIIDEDIHLISKQHIPFEDNDYYLDWQLMPSTPGQSTSSVLVGAIPKKVADTYVYLLESMGLGVMAIEIETLAIARSMITAKKVYENEARAILDLGATRSSITIYDHDQIQYSISLPFSGELVTTTVSQKCHIPYETAEQQKIQIGLSYDKTVEPCWMAITTITDQLIDQVKRAIDFYYSHFPGANKVTHITMCGGGASMKKLDEIMTQKLGITAQPGNVWKNLSLRKLPPLSAEESLGYATAIGLGLRAAANPFFRTDAL